MGVLCIKILQNILNTYKVIEWIQLPYLKLQRDIFLRYGSSLMSTMVLYICTIFCENIFKSYRRDMILKMKITN